ncbi:MAG: type II toxin-antitoxin system VapC family toxin [Proteobacteria bacterium]|jgi:hypothetical protein|nr:type II toxin-antitoxin system VapC family toxin [Pseudomonadota bacterium]
MNGARFLLDTNVLIGFLGGAKWAADFFERTSAKKPEYLVSAVTRMELLGFPGITEEEEGRVAALLARLEPVPIDTQVEEAAISLRRTGNLKLPDAIIAATALTRKAALVTADEDFKKVPDLEVVNPRRP